MLGDIHDTMALFLHYQCFRGGGGKGGKRGGKRGLVLVRMEFMFTSVNQDSQNQQATSKQVKIQYDVKQVYS